MEICFKLHGFPDWYKGNRDGKGSTALNASHNSKGATMDNPLRFDEVDYNSSGKMDQSLVNVVCQEVLKAIEGKSQVNCYSVTNMASNSYTLNVDMLAKNQNDKDWMFDTRASGHMTAYSYLLTHIRSLINPIQVGSPDGSIYTIREVGTLPLSSSIVLNDVLLIPDFKHNLLSIPKLVESYGWVVVFTARNWY